MLKRRRIIVFCAALLVISTGPFLLYSSYKETELTTKSSGQRYGLDETSAVHDNEQHSSKPDPSSAPLATTQLQQISDVVKNSDKNEPITTYKSSSVVKRSGYALALSFHDQQTWALGNLYSLQDWATSLNMSVLQPFLLSTTLGIPSDNMTTSCLPLGTLYDIKYWNENVKLSGSTVTVGWNEFIISAPRSMILVQTNPSLLKCSMADIRSKVMFMTRSFGFHVERELCLSRPPMSVEMFNKKILGNFSAHEVTVVFSEWSQNTAGSVLNLISAHKPMALSSTLPLLPSTMINNNAESYISKYFNDGKFIAVLFRSEWLTMYSSVTFFNNILQECVSKALDYVQKAKKIVDTESVFLGLDVGRFGSKTVEPDKERIALTTFESRLIPVTQFDSFSSWEESFEAVSNYSVAGYVAHLQRTIALRSNCLLLLGSGSFLKQALDHYKLVKTSHHTYCYIETDGKCNIFRKSGF